MKLVQVAAMLVLISAPCWSGGCAGSMLEGADQELELLNNKLSQGTSPQKACQELAALCNATGFGCKAHSLFCGAAPTKASICQQLKATCAAHGYQPACTVFNQQCQGGPDGGVGNADQGPVCNFNGACNKAAGETCASCPADCCPGKSYPDAGSGNADQGPVCNFNGACNKAAGETCTSCPVDCCPGKSYPDAGAGSD